MFMYNVTCVYIQLSEYLYFGIPTFIIVNLLFRVHQLYEFLYVQFFFTYYYMSA